jgi:hypothetical protein
MVQSLHLTYDIVIQLQSLKAVKTLEVVDLNDVFVGEGEMGELPQGGVVFPEDLVLAVILNQVFPKQT